MLTPNPNNNTMDKTTTRLQESIELCEKLVPTPVGKKWHPLKDKFVRLKWVCRYCKDEVVTIVPDLGNFQTPQCDCGDEMDYNGILLNCGLDPLRNVYTLKYHA